MYSAIGSSGGNPARWVSNSSTVIFDRSPPSGANSGMYRTTGSPRRILPSSTRIITAGAVATALVREATSKTVSVVMGSLAGSSARFP